MDLTRAVWRTSTRSGNTGGDCVEVTRVAPVVAVRDSKDQQGPMLTFGERDWTSFVAAVKHGRFDQ